MSPFSVVYDDAFEHEARHVAQTLLLEPIHVKALAKGQLRTAPRLFVDANLRDLETVAALRHAIDKPPTDRDWVFAVERGVSRHAWLVQADALGATRHVNRDRCIDVLRQLMSVAGLPPLRPARERELGAAVGGETILKTGKKLAGLFNGIASGASLEADTFAMLGLEIVDSVSAAGPGAWLDTVRGYHEGTFQHCLLVTGAAASYAERYALNKGDAVRLTTAALLHDIGKAVVPLHILDKAGRLSEEEFAAIKLHPAAGYDYLIQQGQADLAILDAVLHHHEALDGSGYPDGLRAPQIATLTRILTVCDVFAALVEARAYKAPKSPEHAIAALVAMAIDHKVDYTIVRNLARNFGMDPPATLAEVIDNVAKSKTAA